MEILKFQRRTKMSKKIKAEEYMNWDKTMVKELTPLEALNNLTQLAFNYAELDEDIIHNAKRYHNIIETTLKALKLIKEKPETFYLINSNDYETYFELASDMVIIEKVYTIE